MLRMTHEMAGSISSNPAITLCISQQSAAWLSTPGKRPTKGSSLRRNLRNLRNLRSLGKPGNLCSPGNLYSHRSRAKLPALRCRPFPCRRDGTWPS
jgi:hypothetical protein